MKYFSATLIFTYAFIALYTPLVSADSVTFRYSANIATLTGPTIFGINPALGTEVTGFFTYETSTADSSADANRGNYAHTFGGGFQANIAGFNTRIEGSDRPFVQIENFGTDTFRYVDGSSPFNQVNPDGVMRLNGIDNANIELFLAISDSSGAAFSNDSLPDPFPITMPPTLPHTFSLNDGSVTMLLQFTSVTAIPEPSVFGLSLIGLAMLGTKRRRSMRS